LVLRVLGNSDSKGKTLEKLVATILDKEGYGEIKTRVHAIGMELDLDAIDKVSNEPLLCECKAQAEQTGTGDLTDFLGKLAYHDSSTSLTKGKFLSLSGFNGIALKWYSTLNDRDRSRLELYDGDKIVMILRKHGLLLSDDSLDRIIRKNTEYAFGERYIVSFESYLYVIQILRIGGSASHYLILTSEEELVNRAIEKEIVELDEILRGLTKIDLKVLEEATISLLDMNSKTTAQISEEIVESERDILVAVEELLASGLAISEHINGEDSLTLKRDIVTLTKLANRFCESKNKYRFMLSNYIEKVVTDDFASYVFKRFRLDEDETQMKIIIRTARIFPSVLLMLLKEDTTAYENSYRQMRQLKNQPIVRKKFNDIVFHGFANSVMMEILRVLKTKDTNYLNKKGVRGYYMKNILKMASPEEQIFSLYAQGFYYLAAAKGPTKHGEIVFFDEQGALGSANVLMVIEEFQMAIDHFSDIIQHEHTHEILKVAWHHKGLCHKAIKQYGEARDCFLKALEYDGNLVPALRNLAECYDSLGESENAKILKDKLDKIQSIENDSKPLS
jgi:tetratricopeptide (TPR) repeat protein